MNRNLITITIPYSTKKKSVFSDPVIYAVVLGVVCGFILRQLPADPRAFILDNIASPLQSKILALISGVMGPVVFISMTSVIIALDSVEDLTNFLVKYLQGACIFLALVINYLSVTLSDSLLPVKREAEDHKEV